MSSSPEVVVVGSANVDLIVEVDTLVRPGETVLARDSHARPGGKGSNQALAAAALGRRVCFVGRVGDGEPAQLMRDAWRAAGVDTQHVQASDAPTGQALCCVDHDGESSIVVIAGANAHVTSADVEAAGGPLSDAAVVLAQLEIPLEAVTAAARATRGTFVLNAAPARSLPADLLAATDVLMVNETELAAVAGIDTSDSDLASRLTAAGLPPVVVITVGARGALLWSDGRLTRVPAPAVQAVDTTGAGDELAGAFADAVARGEDMEAATRWAVTAASLSTLKIGATSAQPRAADVHRALAGQQTPGGRA